MDSRIPQQVAPETTSKPKVLILPCPTSGGTLGTVGYLLAIAEKLRDKADILVHTSGYCYDFMSRYGFKVSKAPKPIPETETIEINDLIDAMMWMGLLEKSFINESVESEIDIINTFEPDVIVSDFHLTAPLSAEYCDIPLVSLAAVPTHPKYMYLETRYGYMADVFDDVCERLDLPLVTDVRELCYLRSDVPIATSWPEFEPDIQNITNIEYIGALVHESQQHINNIQWKTDKKKIFSYLSISALPPSLYIPILRKSFPEGEYEVICSVGAGFDKSQLESLRGHIQIVNWAPMDTLFPFADLVIYHGGQGTGMTAAKHQVPSIAIPGQHYERIYNADRFDELKIGVKMETANFRPGVLKRTFHQLQEDDFKESLLTVSKNLKSLGGAEQAANLIIRETVKKQTNF